MSGRPRYWGRYYKLTIRPPGGSASTFETETGPSMDIKFDVTYARGQLAREGTVSILGLGYEKIHSFLSLAAMARGRAMSELAQLTLQVGYTSQGSPVEVLNGYVWYGSVTSPPEMWLTLKVAEYNPIGGKTAVISCTEETPLNEFLNFMCDKYSEAEGVRIGWKDKTQDAIADSGELMVTCQFTEELTLADCLRKITKELSDKVQFILRTTSYESTGYGRIIEVLDKPDELVTKGNVTIDSKHGLLSVSGIDCVSGCVTTFIDSEYVDALCNLQLTSKLNEQANGKYYIFKKQYVGHYLGPEWYVKYYCSGKQGGEN